MIYTRTALFVLIVVIGLGVLMHRAYSHQAPAGWSYDYECCANNDCAPVLEMGSSYDGRMTVTTKHGTAVYSPKTVRKISKDERYHACIIDHASPRLKCLYTPAAF